MDDVSWNYDSNTILEIDILSMFASCHLFSYSFAANEKKKTTNIRMGLRRNGKFCSNKIPVIRNWIENWKISKETSYHWIRLFSISISIFFSPSAFPFQCFAPFALRQCALVNLSNVTRSRWDSIVLLQNTKIKMEEEWMWKKGKESSSIADKMKLKWMFHVEG